MIEDIQESATEWSTKRRWLSGAEFLLGAAIVIAHNVYHKLPNEVPILFVLAFISLTVRDGKLAVGFQSAGSKLRAILTATANGFRSIGLRRPASWTRTLLVALTAAGSRIVLGNLVILPIATRFWPRVKPPSVVSDITGRPWIALAVLLFVWVFAAFGEEVGYRGYLLNRAGDVGKRSKAAYVVGLILVSILFGYGHFYKGPAGMLDSGIAGLILGAVYLLMGRNLWVSILAHGFIDTFAVAVEFFGWTS